LINLTEEKYSIANSNIQRHIIGFVPTIYITTTMYKDSVINAPIVNQLIKIYQYRINHEAYQYFKNINSLLSAQGKIFDPIVFQFQGNLTCKTDSKKLVLGFFEASSVKTNTYYIRPGANKVNRTHDFIPPSPSGCSSSAAVADSTSEPVSPVPPDFWIY
jgi:hypothetical protein